MCWEITVPVYMSSSVKHDLEIIMTVRFEYDP